MRRTIKFGTLIFLAAILILSGACSADKDPVILKCNGLEIKKSTFVLYMTEEAVRLYNNGEASIDKIIAESKEYTLNSLRYYTYYKQSYTSQDYSLTAEESSTIRVNILSSLMSSGLTYKDSEQDKVFMEKFGAEFEEYMTFYEEKELINRFFEDQSQKTEVTDEEAYAFYLENISDYAVYKADIIQVKPDISNKEQVISDIENKLKDGIDIKEIVNEYSDEIIKNVTIEFDDTSNLDTTFGEGFVDAVIKSSENDVVTLEDTKGTAIAKVVSILGYEEGIEAIKKDAGVYKYLAHVDELIKDDKYVMELNKNVYDSVTTIPGMQE